MGAAMQSKEREEKDDCYRKKIKIGDTCSTPSSLMKEVAFQ